MSIDWREYFYYFVAYFVLMTCFASATLFLYVYKKEKLIRTIWRPVGFGLLVLAFFLLIVERVLPFMTITALVILWMGFYCIYKGVMLEPSLKHLLEAKKIKTKKLKEKKSRGGILADTIGLLKILIGGFVDDLTAIWSKSKKTNEKDKNIRENLFQTGILRELISFVLIVALFGLVVVAILFAEYLPAYLEMMSLVFILATIYIQIQRYKYEKTDWLGSRQNLYPLLGYIFLAGRSLLVIYDRLPSSTTVEYYAMTQDYGFMWYLVTIFTCLGFLFLGLWIWNFIRVRVLNSIYGIFMLVMGVVAILGATMVSNSINAILLSGKADLRSEIVKYAMIDTLDKNILTEGKNRTGYEWVLYVGKQVAFSTWSGAYTIDKRNELGLIEKSWNEKVVIDSIISRNRIPYFLLLAPMSADEQGASRILGMYAPTKMIFDRAYPELLQVFGMSVAGIMIIMWLFYWILWREKGE